MDVSRLRQGERIAAISGIALIFVMFVFKWFGLEASGSNAFGVAIPGVETSFNAWQSFGLIDIVLFLAAVSAIALAYVSAARQRLDLPVPLATIVAGLGILGVLLIVFRLISPPDFGDLGGAVDETRKIGAFLGLIATAGVAYGGWQAMQEQGASFGEVGDRLSGGAGGPDGPGGPTPPSGPPAGGPPAGGPPPAGPPAGEPPAGGPPPAGPPPGGPPAA